MPDPTTADKKGAKLSDQQFDPRLGSPREALFRRELRACTRNAERERAYRNGREGFGWGGRALEAGGTERARRRQPD